MQSLLLISRITVPNRFLTNNYLFHIKEHKRLIRSTLGGNARNIDNIHDKEFPNWFEKKVSNIYFYYVNKIDNYCIRLFN